MRLQRLAAAVATAALALALVPAPASAAPLVVPDPPREGGLAIPQAPTVSAASWLVYDADADLILGSSAADEQRPMASTTKIMTVLVALRYGDLDDIVTVSQRAADVGEAEVGLVAGETLSMRTLLTSLVVRSANDSAMAVAEHLGGSVEGFVNMMNAEAEAMGLSDTHFENPHGLDGENHYSSAADLLEMSLAAMSYPEFRVWATIIENDFPPAPDGTERSLGATNRLLETYPGTIGVKTGFTGLAGLVFSAAATREDRTLFVVVMGSEGERAHFADARVLLDWGFERFRSIALVRSGTYEPPEPVRVVESGPAPEPDPEPVVETHVRRADGEPPPLSEAWRWLARMTERITDGG